MAVMVAEAGVTVVVVLLSVLQAQIKTSDEIRRRTGLTDNAFING